MFARNSARRLLAVCIFLGASSLALAADHLSDQGTSIFVRSPYGAATFLVADPTAARSDASRDNGDLAEKDGTIPPSTSGWQITSQVVLHADAAAVLQLQNEGTIAHVSEIVGVPGFWLATQASVADAVALADRLATDPRVADAYVDMQRPFELRSPTDPGYPNQWHLNNIAAPLFDVNAEPAWNAGYTGAGITIGIVELGWQTDHPDLAANYNAAASQTGAGLTSHGTSVAGVAAARANNGIGGVGIAYDAQISKQYIGTSATNATALGFLNDLNHIKTNSWGPSDNNTAWTNSAAEKTAIQTGITTGRGGKGTIFVWAAGNGGLVNDRVDYDPYASSRYTIAIGSIGDLDTRSTHNESGSAMFFVTETDGNVRGIYTTAATSTYTSAFGGSSSASPLAAGTIALMLQANPNLTWRDVQHVLVRTARQCDIANAGWTTNGAGHHISYDYGYGAVDAGAATAMAATWQSVAPEVSIDTGTVVVNQAIPDNSVFGVTRTVAIPQDIRIESVELVINATTTYVGDLQIQMTAPSGTQSLVAKTRTDAQDNYNDYVFTSRRHWDEHSAGTWSVYMQDGKLADFATWNSFGIRVYGTRRCPADFNLDGQVNESDLGLLLQAWQTTAGGDADGDGDTDESDLGLLLQEWQSACP
ncbi:MAG: S8 family serine peptidase [Phycisphaerae bacterium]